MRCSFEKRTLVFGTPSGYNREKAAAAEKEESRMKTVIVDAVGDQCPIPVVKATKALR